MICYLYYNKIKHYFDNIMKINYVRITFQFLKEKNYNQLSLEDIEKKLIFLIN